mmetsp:Transcript_14628/g.20864  ORF Transcript_14628/g.20864 Transcript_14628/m.20864 type:complete len:127 (+) Transcript_14628:243-623(+)
MCHLLSKPQESKLSLCPSSRAVNLDSFFLKNHVNNHRMFCAGRENAPRRDVSTMVDALALAASASLLPDSSPSSTMTTGYLFSAYSSQLALPWQKSKMRLVTSFLGIRICTVESLSRMVTVSSTKV